MIDLEATHNRVKACTIPAIARYCDATPSLVHMMLTRKYRSMHGEKPQRVLARLRELGLLVEIPDDSAAAS